MNNFVVWINTCTQAKIIGNVVKKPLYTIWPTMDCNSRQVYKVSCLGNIFQPLNLFFNLNLTLKFKWTTQSQEWGIMRAFFIPFKTNEMCNMNETYVWKWINNIIFLLPPLFSWSNRGSVYSHKVSHSPSRLIKLSREAL